MDATVPALMNVIAVAAVEVNVVASTPSLSKKQMVVPVPAAMNVIAVFVKEENVLD